MYRFRNLFFSLEILIFPRLVENVLPSSLKQDLVSLDLLLAEEWLLFCVFSKESKFFVAEKKSGLHKRELLKCHENFPIFVFEESLLIEIAW